MREPTRRDFLGALGGAIVPLTANFASAQQLPPIELDSKPDPARGVERENALARPIAALREAYLNVTSARTDEASTRNGVRFAQGPEADFQRVVFAEIQLGKAQARFEDQLRSLPKGSDTNPLDAWLERAKSDAALPERRGLTQKLDLIEAIEAKRTENRIVTDIEGFRKLVSSQPRQVEKGEEPADGIAALERRLQMADFKNDLNDLLRKFEDYAEASANLMVYTKGRSDNRESVGRYNEERNQVERSKSQLTQIFNKLPAQERMAAQEVIRDAIIDTIGEIRGMNEAGKIPVNEMTVLSQIELVGRLRVVHAKDAFLRSFFPRQ